MGLASVEEDMADHPGMDSVIKNSVPGVTESEEIRMG